MAACGGRQEMCREDNGGSEFEYAFFSWIRLEFKRQ